MSLPFTTEQFLAVFREYNNAIWPVHVVAYVVGIAVVVVLFRGEARDRFTWLALAALWIWNGLVYHILHFSRINPAAYGFGFVFLLQGLLFLRFTARPSSEKVAEKRADLRQIMGALMVAYAMFGYPLAGISFGHHYPASPVFGVAPCPTVIFTFGALIWSRTRFPFYLLIIPILWSVVATSATVALGMIEDFGLPVSALLTIATLSIPSGRSVRPTVSAT